MNAVRILKMFRCPPYNNLISLSQRFSKGSKDLTPSQGKQQVTSQTSHELMDRTYQQTPLPGQQNRNVTQTSDLQNQILQKSEFDLMNPEIRPTMAPLSSYTGVEKDQLRQIDLGTLKVKDNDEVLLSEVDPYNIPEDYDIKFDTIKQFSLVGRKVGTADSQHPPRNIMPISKHESIEVKTVQELSAKYFGVGFKLQLNNSNSRRRKTFWIILLLLVIHPFVQTVVEYKACENSINEIEGEQMKEIDKIRQKNAMKVLFSSKDFNPALKQDGS